jgi:GxxExxY protein
MVTERGGQASFRMAIGELIEERLTHSVIGAFFEVYRALGYGFLEQVYVVSLAYELETRGHAVAREVSVPIHYKGRLVAFQRIDMIVDGKLIVETKSSSEVHKAAPRQLFNYLRATGLEVGLLLHFGPQAKFHRMISRPSRDNPVSPAPSG